jgi:hypothetical protein
MTRQRRRENPAAGVAKTPEEIQRVRNQVTNAIADEAVEMVVSSVRAVKKGGNVSTLKYLLQVAGLFPAPAPHEREPESLREVLVRQLGLSPKPPAEGVGEEGNVES